MNKNKSKKEIQIHKIEKEEWEIRKSKAVEDQQHTLPKDDKKKDEHLLPKYEGEFMVAIYDYEARVHDDVSFQKGDILEVIEKEDGSDWWYAEHRKSGTKGYVPRLYVAQLHSIEAAP